MKLQWEQTHAHYKSPLGVTLYAHLHYDNETYAAFVKRGRVSPMPMIFAARFTP